MSSGVQSASRNNVSSQSTVLNSEENQKHVALLLAIAETQDRNAFEELFRSFARRVYGMGIKITGNEQMAKDLVQDVMLTIWQNAKAFRADRGSAKSWIFTLSRNKSIDMLRRAQRQPATITTKEIWPEDLFDRIGDQPSQGNNQSAADDLDIRVIRQLSDRLPKEQRLAIALVYLQDHTHEEAASIMGIPLGTCKSRLRLGMGKLREWISDKHD